MTICFHFLSVFSKLSKTEVSFLDFFVFLYFFCCSAIFSHLLRTYFTKFSRDFSTIFLIFPLSWEIVFPFSSMSIQVESMDFSFRRETFGETFRVRKVKKVKKSCLPYFELKSQHLTVVA
jgi:hypothetical protein